MDNPSDASHVSLGIYLWNGVLTLLFGMMGWNWNKLDGRVEQKADKGETDRRFNEMLAAINRAIDSQQIQHQDNTKRLDEILKEVYRNRAP